jgi:NAD(P)-dependent dehydrogenase (short-subunit alcohol dehydrogenase family)
MNCSATCVAKAISPQVTQGDGEARRTEMAGPGRQQAAPAHHGLWRLGGYCAATHAVLGLVRALACDLQGAGVNAIAVSPGSTRPTSCRRPRTSDSSPTPNNSQVTQLACRLLEPEEVTSVVAWACSPDARAVTGSVLHADRDP